MLLIDYQPANDRSIDRCFLSPRCFSIATIRDYTNDLITISRNVIQSLVLLQRFSSSPPLPFPFFISTTRKNHATFDRTNYTRAAYVGRRMPDNCLESYVARCNFGWKFVSSVISFLCPPFAVRRFERGKIWNKREPARFRWATWPIWSLAWNRTFLGLIGRKFPRKIERYGWYILYICAGWAGFN